MLVWLIPSIGIEKNWKNLPANAKQVQARAKETSFLSLD